MEVEDLTVPEAPPQSLADIAADLLKLIDGLEGATFTCACRRMFRPGFTVELARIAQKFRAALTAAGKKPEEMTADSRWPWLEVD